MGMALDAGPCPCPPPLAVLLFQRLCPGPTRLMGARVSSDARPDKRPLPEQAAGLHSLGGPEDFGSHTLGGSSSSLCLSVLHLSLPPLLGFEGCCLQARWEAGRKVGGHCHRGPREMARSEQSWALGLPAPLLRGSWAPHLPEVRPCLVVLLPGLQVLRRAAGYPAPEQPHEAAAFVLILYMGALRHRDQGTCPRSHKQRGQAEAGSGSSSPCLPSPMDLPPDLVPA